MPLPKGYFIHWDSLCSNSYLLKSIDKRFRLLLLGLYFLIYKIWAITTVTPTDKSLLSLTMVEVNNKHRHGGDDVNDDCVAEDNT